MDPRTHQHLETRIREEIQTILTEGDRPYLQGLSREDLVEALENERRFLGLYAYSDTETPAVIRALLEQHLDQWAKDFLLPAQADSPHAHIEIVASPFTHIRASATIGLLKTEASFYIEFLSSKATPYSQISPSPA